MRSSGDFSVFSGLAPASRPAKLPPGYSLLGDIGRHYDPNEPRVPAGHPDGGQWTRGGSRGGEIVSGAPSRPKLGVQYAANDNSGWDDLDRSHRGMGPNVRHDHGVAAAMKDLAERGYAVTQETEVRVDVPGFATPRIYDFVVEDPISRALIGVEVKTTLYDVIWLNTAQVEKDVAVVKLGGTAPLFKARVDGVAYVTYCWGCDQIPDLESIDLFLKLKARDIPFFHRGLPPRILPYGNSNVR